MLAARKAKLAKRRERIMKPYRLDESDTETVLSLPRQFKRVCDPNGVSEDVSMWLLPFFMTKSPAASLSTRLTLSKDVDAPAIVRRGIGG